MSTETPQRHKPDAQEVGALGLTRFQIDLLAACRDVERGGKIPKGPNLRQLLQERLQKEVTHGQLYPNLDTLVDKQLVTKSQYNRRTNISRITERGRRYLNERAALLGGES